MKIDSLPPVYLLGTQNPDEATEGAIVGANSGKGALALYGKRDSKREPVVLVHGIEGAPADLLALAQRLDAQGLQVYFFCFNDCGRSPHDNGADLARALRGLKQWYPDGTRLNLVAHSMGGIVARSALDSLQNPSWLEHTDITADPRAGFANVRFRTLDTPWDGFSAGPLDWPIVGAILRPITHFFMWLFGWDALYDMTAKSDMYAHLYETKLEGVDYQNTAAHQKKRQRDGIHSLDDFSREDRHKLAAALVGGTTPRDTQTRNYFNAIAADTRAPTLRERWAEDLLTLSKLGRDSVLRDWRETMPPVDGTHTTILGDRVELENTAGDDDWVDRMSKELAPK